MIATPTTEQLLADCSRELLETVRPAVSDPAVQIAVDMLANVIRNAATRAGHEIAWMHDEIAEMTTFAQAVATSGDAGGPLTAALDALASVPQTSLHLDDVARRYSLAGEAFSCAIEAAAGAGDATRTREATAILLQRNEREMTVVGDWAMVGRG